MMTLELTKRCNLRCYHCYVGAPREELDTTQWIRVVEQLSDLGTAAVGLSGGEIGLCDDWKAIAEAVRARRMMLSLLTNGTLFDDGDLDDIARLHPVRVSTSLYGADAHSHELVTGVEGSFERTVASIRGLRERGMTVRISTVLMRGVDTEAIERLQLLAEELDCNFTYNHTLYPADDGDKGVTRHRVDDDEFRRFVAAHATDMAITSIVAGRDEDLPRKEMYSCRAGHSHGFVDAYGLLRPCMGFEPPLGNVTKTGVAGVWRGRVAQTHRRTFAEPLRACGECGISGYCTARCPRMAALEGGDVLGVDPQACRLAEAVREAQRRGNESAA
jgi:radical SAM protein with 4Fe4S-binding SPASM domain